jgi:hypothetical protein
MGDSILPMAFWIKVNASKITNIIFLIWTLGYLAR